MRETSIHPNPIPILPQNDLGRSYINTIRVQKGNHRVDAGAIGDFVDHLGEVAIDAQELAVIAKMAQREFMAEAAFGS